MPSYTDYFLPYKELGEKADGCRVVLKKDVVAFAKLYNEILNTVYHHFKLNKICFSLNMVYCAVSYNGSCPDELPAQEIEEAFNKTLKELKQFRFYKDNTIYIGKPNNKMYWLKSAAIRDADETAFDLFEQGY